MFRDRACPAPVLAAPAACETARTPGPAAGTAGLWQPLLHAAAAHAQDPRPGRGAVGRGCRGGRGRRRPGAGVLRALPCRGRRQPDGGLGATPSLMARRAMGARGAPRVAFCTALPQPGVTLVAWVGALFDPRTPPPVVAVKMTPADPDAIPALVQRTPPAGPGAPGGSVPGVVGGARAQPRSAPRGGTRPGHRGTFRPGRAASCTIRGEWARRRGLPLGEGGRGRVSYNLRRIAECRTNGARRCGSGWWCGRPPAHRRPTGRVRAAPVKWRTIAPRSRP